MVYPLDVEEATYQIMTEFFFTSASIIDTITYSSAKTIIKP